MNYEFYLNSVKLPNRAGISPKLITSNNGWGHEIGMAVDGFVACTHRVTSWPNTGTKELANCFGEVYNPTKFPSGFSELAHRRFCLEFSFSG